MNQRQQLRPTAFDKIEARREALLAIFDASRACHPTPTRKARRNKSDESAKAPTHASINGSGAQPRP
jgi:hypothetical protein